MFVRSCQDRSAVELIEIPLRDAIPQHGCKTGIASYPTRTTLIERFGLMACDIGDAEFPPHVLDLW